MKKTTLYLLITMWHFYSYAQNTSSQTVLYNDSLSALTGKNKLKNSTTNFGVFKHLAAIGDVKAMNTLANMYTGGFSVPQNIDSVIYWYKEAAKLKNTFACIKLGRLYKEGLLVEQDFITAAKYFKTAADLNDDDGKNQMAYLYYKGFGVKQNYSRAFNIYKDLANKDNLNANAMYFLGLCYRNGYGIEANNDLAKLWLMKAAQKNYLPAVHELNEEPFPENMSVISPYLQEQVNSFESYREKYFPDEDNNYEGAYNGYAIYYDWSGKFVNAVEPLSVNIIKSGSVYKGTWQEGDDSTTSIIMNISKNKFTFDSSCKYTRINHYSNRKSETWHFNNASLKLAFVNDSIQLNGLVNFYSTKRMEPGKPMKIILKKGYAKQTNEISPLITKMSVSPNPAASLAKVTFTISKDAKIGVEITSANGIVIFIENAKLLPMGTYNYSFSVDQFSAGVYTVKIIIDGKMAITKQFVKQ